MCGGRGSTFRCLPLLSSAPRAPLPIPSPLPPFSALLSSPRPPKCFLRSRWFLPSRCNQSHDPSLVSFLVPRNVALLVDPSSVASVMPASSVSPLSSSPPPGKVRQTTGRKKRALKRKQSRETSFQKRRRERVAQDGAGALAASTAGNRLKSMAFPGEELATGSDFFSGGSSRVRSSQLTLLKDFLKRKGGAGSKTTAKGVGFGSRVAMDPWVGCGVDGVVGGGCGWGLWVGGGGQRGGDKKRGGRRLLLDLRRRFKSRIDMSTSKPATHLPHNHHEQQHTRTHTHTHTSQTNQFSSNPDHELAYQSKKTFELFAATPVFLVLSLYFMLGAVPFMLELGIEKVRGV